MPARMKLPPISEEQFKKQILQYAKLRGWKVAHFRPGRQKCRNCQGTGCAACNGTGETWRTAVEADGKGFPDLVLVRDGMTLFVELKTDKGTVTPEQQQWLNVLKKADQVAMVWRPAGWEAIERLLR